MKKWFIGIVLLLAVSGFLGFKAGGFRGERDLHGDYIFHDDVKHPFIVNLLGETPNKVINNGSPASDISYPDHCFVADDSFSVDSIMITAKVDFAVAAAGIDSIYVIIANGYGASGNTTVQVCTTNTLLGADTAWANLVIPAISTSKLYALDHKRTWYFVGTGVGDFDTTLTIYGAWAYCSYP
jgi:hypothetical protein